MSRVVTEHGHRLLLRGFGQPNEVANCDSRIIILFEEIGSTAKEEKPQIRGRMTGPELQTMDVRMLANL